MYFLIKYIVKKERLWQLIHCHNLFLVIGYEEEDVTGAWSGGV